MPNRTQTQSHTQPLAQIAALATELARDQGWAGCYTLADDGILWVGDFGPEYAAHLAGGDLVVTDDQEIEREPLMLAADHELTEVSR